jgi:hypothetical protein
MEINQTLSIKVSFLAAAFMLSLGARAEIFLGSNTNVNSLVVASNEVILISAIRGDNASSSYQGQINLNGTIQTNILFLDFDLYGQKYALAGPATLSFPANSGTNSLPVCVCFQRIRGTSIQSVFWSPNTTTTIQVPAGKTCHFFKPFPSLPAFNNPSGEVLAPVSPLISVQTVSGVVSNIWFFGGEEFTGSATITFGGYYYAPQKIVLPDPYVISFYQTDDALNLPSGVLQGSTGSFVITVEKSTDLTHWSPEIIQVTGDDQAAFYRLNFSH